MVVSDGGMDEMFAAEAEHAIGMAFRLTRRRLRLSQRELADRPGWDASAVGRWESGHVAVALGRIDGVLRGMGFRLAVVPLDAREAGVWADVEPPTEHIADRGFRKFPAHLDHAVLTSTPLHWMLRYKCKPNVMAPGWTFVKRSPWGSPSP